LFKPITQRNVDNYLHSQHYHTFTKRSKYMCLLEGSVVLLK